MNVFDSATAFLDHAAEAPAGVVPDAVLNRAKCLVVVPASHVGRPVGVASCRTDAEKWETPWLVEFDPSSPHEETVLVFVLTQSSAERLARGTLDLTGRHKAPPGPVVAKMVVVTDADLNTDAVGYIDEGSTFLAKAVTGKFTRQPHPPVGKELEFSDRLVAAMTSFFNTITPVGIILHHSAVLPGDDSAPSNLKEVETFHRSRGFEIRCQGHVYNVAYHYLVMPDGSVRAGRPERCRGAHAHGYNAFIGIAVVGDFSSVDNPDGKKGETTPTPEQMKAVAALCRKLMKKYDIPLQRVLRHSDVGATRCPGDRFPFAALLRTLEAPS